MDFAIAAAPAFWLALLSIVITNILLSGDNAVVIALASRNLPKEQQGKAIFWGTALAIALRIILTITAVQLLTLPYLKIAGAIALMYIGVQLIADGGDDALSAKAQSHLWGAIRTIFVADLVMSLDNVVAVAAAAQNGPVDARLALLIIGLALSIPLIIFGSTLLLKVIERFPMMIILGAGLLGLLAGGMLLDDPIMKAYVQLSAIDLHMLFGGIGAVSVILLGLHLKRKNTKRSRT